MAQSARDLRDELDSIVPYIVDSEPAEGDEESIDGVSGVRSLSMVLPPPVEGPRTVRDRDAKLCLQRALAELEGHGDPRCLAARMLIESLLASE